MIQVPKILQQGCHIKSVVLHIFGPWIPDYTFPSFHAAFPFSTPPLSPNPPRSPLLPHSPTPPWPPYLLPPPPSLCPLFFCPLLGIPIIRMVVMSGRTLPSCCPPLTYLESGYARMVVISGPIRMVVMSRRWLCPDFGYLRMVVISGRILPSPCFPFPSPHTAFPSPSLLLPSPPLPSCCLPLPSYFFLLLSPFLPFPSPHPSSLPRPSLLPLLSHFSTPPRSPYRFDLPPLSPPSFSPLPGVYLSSTQWFCPDRPSPHTALPC
uniref:Uncharacterized protein n=1 Tax=Eptatretus burgeri TaxID=7764 RepID=A0A8C4Q373_EPTBU